MKRIVLFAFGLLLLSANAFSQAKKPTIMVVPSSIYMERHNYTTTYQDGFGKTKSTPDYDKAFRQDENLRLVISEMGKIMADRGFPLKDLEQTLRGMSSDDAQRELLTSRSGSSIVESPMDELKRVAKADIIMDLDFTIKNQGPRKYITFNLRGMDAYTDKLITAASGSGDPSASATVGTLLEEAVLNYMDGFNAALQNHFNDMFANGREAKITVLMFDSCPLSFEDELQFMGETVTLMDVVDYWLSENCVHGRFSTNTAGEFELVYEQVRTPLFRTVLGKERPTDTRAFVNELGKFLSEQIQLPYKINTVGLGEAWLILGDK
ncbi:MAG: hypothetical protein IKV28_02150 [Bacteroidales bacterium]|nr:hypothetical protein [Bacteroidales bacterium]